MMTREEVIKDISRVYQMPEKEAEVIIGKAEEGGEIGDAINVDEWYRNRFQANCVLIDEEGYSRMCIDALKILRGTAATDYGSSRQRDLGQLWADMTRGYLGEFAFQLFLESKCDMKTKLGHEVGNLAEFLPMDIHQVKESNGEYRAPNIRISVKTTKWNGIWMDVPGDQFNHSDVHVLVKIGGGRDHLFAFFKSLSVFKDKVLKRGQDVGVLSQKESEDLFDSLPSFKPIPAYICGFVRRDAKYKKLAYDGKKGRINYTISSWNGPIFDGDLASVKAKEDVTGKVKFSGIGEFSHPNGYLFNTGSLLWKVDDWKVVFGKI